MLWDSIACAMTTSNNRSEAARQGIDFRVHVQIPRLAGGVQAGYHICYGRVGTADQVPGRPTSTSLARPPLGERSGTIPNSQVVDRGFHDVTLIDMDQADEPVVPVEELGLLRRQWPMSVVSGIAEKQAELELMHQKCKQHFRAGNPALTVALS